MLGSHFRLKLPHQATFTNLIDCSKLSLYRQLVVSTPCSFSHGHLTSLSSLPDPKLPIQATIKKTVDCSKLSLAHQPVILRTPVDLLTGVQITTQPLAFKSNFLIKQLSHNPLIAATFHSPSSQSFAQPLSSDHPPEAMQLAEQMCFDASFHSPDNQSPPVKSMTCKANIPPRTGTKMRNITM